MGHKCKNEGMVQKKHAGGRKYDQDLRGKGEWECGKQAERTRGMQTGRSREQEY
jgi:hypothetical protein